MWFLARVIWFVAGVIVTALLLRFVFLLLGANPLNGFVDFIYDFTGPFVAPFRGIFGTTIATSGQHILEWATLVAIAVYSIAAALIVQLITPRRRTTTVDEV